MLITNIINPKDFINRVIKAAQGCLSVYLKTFLLSFISSESEFLQNCSKNKMDDLKRLLNS